MKRLHAQDGMAMVIAIMVVLITLSMAMGAFAFVQGQQKATADERVRDSSYALAESALDSAVVYMGVRWPNSVPKGNAAPGAWGKQQADGSNSTYRTCGPASTATDNCPDPASVTDAFTQSGDARNPDYGGSPNWITSVHDDAGPTPFFYQESTSGTQAGYDANNNNLVWVRAESIVQGRRRVLVALVGPTAVETANPLPFPMSVISMPHGFVHPTFYTGQHFLVDAQGSSSMPAMVRTYCGQFMPPTLSTCGAFRPANGHVQPWTVSSGAAGYTCNDDSGTPWGANQYYCSVADTNATIDSLRAAAQTPPNKYIAPGGACPASLSGEVVFFEWSSYCQYSSGTFNSEDDPGMLVIGLPSGGGPAIHLDGTATYHGLIYFAGAQPFNGARLLMSGSSKVVGAIAMDANSVIEINSSARPAIIYNSKVHYEETTTSSSPSAPKIIAGTFREVPPNY